MQLASMQRHCVARATREPLQANKKEEGAEACAAPHPAHVPSAVSTAEQSVTRQVRGAVRGPAHPIARQLELLLRGQAVLLQQHALHGEQRVRDRQRHRQRQLVCAPGHSRLGTQAAEKKTKKKTGCSMAGRVLVVCRAIGRVRQSDAHESTAGRVLMMCRAVDFVAA